MKKYSEYLEQEKLLKETIDLGTIIDQAAGGQGKYKKFINKIMLQLNPKDAELFSQMLMDLYHRGF